MDKYTELAERHREADMLVSGTYGFTEWCPDAGCSVGCMAHDLGLSSDDHAALAAAVGLPPQWLYLVDAIFEGLLDGECQKWHVNFWAAREGLSHQQAMDAFSRWMIWLMRGEASRHIVDKSITDNVAALYERRLAGDEPTDDEWRAASDAARAAYAAADAAYAADAADAAYAAAHAAHAAADAAYTAADAACATARSAGAACAPARAADAEGVYVTVEGVHFIVEGVHAVTDATADAAAAAYQRMAGKAIEILTAAQGTR